MLNWILAKLIQMIFLQKELQWKKNNLPTEEKRLVYYAQKVILKKNVGNVFKKVAMMRSKRLLTG